MVHYKLGLLRQSCNQIRNKTPSIFDQKLIDSVNNKRKESILISVFWKKKEKTILLNFSTLMITLAKSFTTETYTMILKIY